MKFLITFAYDGSKFSGYQKQPKVLTVQGELERALKEINNNKNVSICASGRTDAGVHALNQKAHFELSINISEEKLKKALNSLLPGCIYVKKVEIVPNDFHARFDVKAKEYIYKINMGEYSPIEKDYIYQYCKPLDVVEIERALKFFEGEHNFKSFTKADDERDNYVRTIFQTNIFRSVKDVNKITILFLGNGFMRYQVRNMIGLLIEIGEGKHKSVDIIKILAEEDRRKAGITAPPQGLYLNDVYY